MKIFIKAKHRGVSGHINHEAKNWYNDVC